MQEANASPRRLDGDVHLRSSIHSSAFPEDWTEETIAPA